LQQDLPQSVPGSDDLKQRFFGDHIATAVERDALVDDDANVDGTGTAFVESLEQLQMGGKDADARSLVPALPVPSPLRPPTSGAEARQGADVIRPRAVTTTH